MKPHLSFTFEFPGVSMAKKSEAKKKPRNEKKEAKTLSSQFNLKMLNNKYLPIVLVYYLWNWKSCFRHICIVSSFVLIWTSTLPFSKNKMTGRELKWEMGRLKIAIWLNHESLRFSGVKEQVNRTPSFATGLNPPPTPYVIYAQPPKNRQSLIQ